MESSCKKRINEQIVNYYLNTIIETFGWDINLDILLKGDSKKDLLEVIKDPDFPEWVIERWGIINNGFLMSKLSEEERLEKVTQLIQLKYNLDKKAKFDGEEILFSYRYGERTLTPRRLVGG